MSESSPNLRPFDDDLAVVIGINKYENGIPELKTAKLDAERLADILKKKHGYQVQPFIDKEATSNNIWNYLKTELPDKINQGQNKRVRLLFYFAGHGTAPQGEDGEAGYLLPQNAHKSKHDNYLSMKKIHDVLTQLGCHHLLIILDCCYAGAFRFGTRDLGSSPEELSKERYNRYQDKVGQVITSAAYDQKALDIIESVDQLKDDRGKFENPEHSPFAGLLLKALEEGDADFTKDGITTVTELNLYLSEKLLELTEKQNKPQISRSWCLPKLDKGEFFFQTGEFDPSKLPEAINLNKDNNPYRGLESFEEAHSRLFFGRSKEIESLYKQINSKDKPLTVVLGISGAGKSSLVKAGLISKLRENPTQWRILEPIRPGATPFKALARAVLALEDTAPDFEPLKQLDAVLRQARKKDPNDNNLNNLFAQWRVTAPEEKLLLIIKNFDCLKELCGEQIEQKTLKNLRETGLSRSRLVLDNFDELKRASDSVEQKQLLNPEEKEQLESFYQDCSKKAQDWSEEWREDGENFANFVKKCSQDKKILLVIDQFEELITQCNQEDKNQFLNALQAALKSCSERLRVVLTLRDDFRHDFENSEQLQEYWKQACFPVAAMGREQLRQAIEQPALTQVLYFEDKDGESLVNQLLKDIGNTSGVLPLLSFTLSELYCKYVEKARNDRTLRWEDYDKLGNVTKALTGKADEEYENLKYNFDNNGQPIEVDRSEVEARQTMLRWVMLRMVSLDGGVPTKRAVLDAELVYADEKSNEIRKLVIDRFVNARLFVRGTNHQEEKYNEPAHDVLIREWSLLKKWLSVEEEQENLVLQKRLAAPTLDWSSQGCTENSPLLWNQDTGRIERLKEIVNSDNCWLNKLELLFFEASVKEHDRQARERLEKEIELYTELSQRLFTANDRLDAIVKLIEAGKVLQKSRLRITEYKELYFIIIFNHLLNELGELNSIDIGEPVNNFTCHQKHKAIATLSGKFNDKIRFWNWNGKPIDFEDDEDYEDEFYDLTCSPDGEVLVTGGNDGIIKFYRKEDNIWHSFYKTQGDSKKHSGRVDCVIFSPDGNILVSAGVDKNLNFWDREGHFIMTLTSDLEDRVPISRVACSPKDNLIAFTPNNNYNKNIKASIIRIWEYQISLNKDYQACSGKSLFEFDTELPDGIKAIDFSPNGEALVVGGGDGGNGILQIWAISKDFNESKLLAVGIDAERITDVAFSPDGKILASSHINSIINLWDTSTITNNSSDELRKLQSLAGHKKEISKIAFTSDNLHLLSSSIDGAVKFWSFRDRTEKHPMVRVLKIFIDNKSIICDVQLSRDNKIVVAAGSDGTVKLYSLDGTILESSIDKHEQEINSLSLSPIEDIFVTASKDNTIGIWRLNRDHRDSLNVNVKLKKLTRHHEQITAIAFSNDGKFFVSGSADGTVIKWSLNAEQVLQTISDVGGSIVHLSLSDDGDMVGVIIKKYINSKPDEYEVKLCSLNNGSIKSLERKTKEMIYVLRFYYENKIIVSVSKSGCLEIWSIDGTRWNMIQAWDKKFEAAVVSSSGEEIAIVTCLDNNGVDCRRIELLNLNLDKVIKTACNCIENYKKIV